MTLLSNITEKCKNEVSVNIINLFFEPYVGFQKILILFENLNLSLTESTHVTQSCFRQNLIKNQTLEKINAKPLILMLDNNFTLWFSFC